MYFKFDIGSDHRLVRVKERIKFLTPKFYSRTRHLSKTSTADTYTIFILRMIWPDLQELLEELTIVSEEIRLFMHIAKTKMFPNNIY